MRFYENEDQENSDWTAIGVGAQRVVERLRETIDPRGYAKSEEAGYGEYNPKGSSEYVETAHVVFVVLRRTRMR